MGADTVHRLLKLGDVELTNALIFFGGHDDGDIAILAPDENRLALGSIQERGESLFGVGSTHGLQMSIIDKLDIMDNQLERRFPFELHCFRVTLTSWE